MTLDIVFAIAGADAFAPLGRISEEHISGRRQNELESAVSQIGQNVTAVQSDVSKMADLDKLYAVCTELD